MLNQTSSESSAEFRVVDAVFVISAPNLKTCPPPDLPEIAIAGRSNVGKSSLINMLCNRRNLAKTSSTPGKTRLINFFRLRMEPGAHHFLLVDLPGYGYSKVNKSMKEEWGQTLEEFLQNRKTLSAMIHLIDARHPPTVQDLQMREWLLHTGLPIITVLTKTDKLKKNDIPKARKTIAQALSLPVGEPCILTSADTRQGKAELTQALFTYTHQETQPEPETDNL